MKDLIINYLAHQRKWTNEDDRISNYYIQDMGVYISIANDITAPYTRSEYIELEDILGYMWTVITSKP